MKKIFLLAIVSLLTISVIADKGDDKKKAKCSKEKSCCKKDSTSKSKACAKMDSKSCDKKKTQK